ncbi:MAG: AAA family ATPase [Candidatus Methylarchaceae archaeon HK02M1]|nr:AAA family ATPase [Candidatus Methylarchaceae archaeon HK02M1]
MTLDIKREVAALQEEYRIIGREEELEHALTAISAGKNILLEGPVGVGKTVIGVAIAKYFGRPFYRVDGDERYTEHKLTGWFDPATVISKGYSWETFIPGPLTQAMIEGAFLFINELNRMPEGTQNVLLPAMDEKQIILSKIGLVKAKKGFSIISTQNPEEFVGTSRLSEALKDRFVLIKLDYQSEDEERKIVHKETGCNDNALIEIAVKTMRATRKDPDIRRGASVRGAIDMVDIVQCSAGSSTLNPEIWTKAAIMALSTKMELQDRATQSMKDVIQRIVTTILKEYSETSGDNSSREDKDINEGKIGHVDAFTLSKNVPRLKDAIKRGDIPKALFIIQDSPQSIYEILCKEGLFETMLQATEHSELKWSAAQLLLTLQTAKLDPTHKRIARKVLNRTIMRMAAQIAGRGVIPTECVEVPFEPGLEDFNIEQTLENKLGKDYLDHQDIASIKRCQKKSAVSLMLDTSNSMQQEKIAIAAIAVGVLAHKLWGDPYSVITFNKHAQLLKPIEDRPNIEILIEKMLELQPGGVTDIKEALEKGLEELEKLDVPEKLGILITDGWVTKGGDPLPVAGKYPRLHVIQVPFTISGDFTTCKNLAKAGRGRYSYVQNFEDLPRAIMRILR